MTIFSPFLGGHRWFCGLRSVAKLLITPFLPNDYHKMGAIIMKHEQWLNIFLCTVRAELYKHLIFCLSRIIWGIFHHLNISDNVPIRAFLNEGTNFQRDHGGLSVQKNLHISGNFQMRIWHMPYESRVCLKLRKSTAVVLKDYQKNDYAVPGLKYPRKSITKICNL